MKSWKTLKKRSLLNHSKYLAVEDHTIQLPNGRIIENWPWLILPDYINVVAVTEDEKIICFRQNKYAIEGTSLAPVGGYLEPGEAPLAAAQRELREETGYDAMRWTDLGDFWVDANRGAGTGHFFLAREAYWAGKIESDDLEDQELLFLSPGEIRAALEAKEIPIMPWAMAFSLALLMI